jgi:hypothetical protein
MPGFSSGLQQLMQPDYTGAETDRSKGGISAHEVTRPSETTDIFN